MASAKQQQAALIGLFTALHNCFIESAFYRQLLQKAGESTYTHRERKGKMATWTTIIVNSYAQPGVSPSVHWAITLTDKTLGVWEVHVGVRAPKIYLSQGKLVEPPLYDDKTFAELFEALRTACREYISTHHISIGKYAPSAAGLFRPE